MLRFTVITICMNEERNIDATIRSVLAQTYTGYEYIIKDGLSKDRTVEIAQSYASAFAEKGIPYRIISRADQGIYDAMNQAVQEACGEWVLFMNAGDLIAEASVLQKVDEQACMDETDIVYGDKIDKMDDLYLRAPARDLSWMRFEMPFCHQSCFTRRELLEENPFSLEYRICSDYLFYLQRYQEHSKFCYIPLTVSIFDINGVSSNAEPRTKELICILDRNPVRDEEAIQHWMNYLKSIHHANFMHRTLWRFIPERMRKMRRLRQKRKQGWKTAEEMFGSGEKYV